MNWAFATNFFLALFAVANPLGKLPYWVKICHEEGKNVRFRLVLLHLLTAFIIFSLLLWFHESLLNVFGLTLASFKIGGGLVIFLTGLSMLQGEQANIKLKELETSNPSDRADVRFRETIVPLVIPLIVGPGSMSTVMIFSSRAQTAGEKIQATLVILLVLSILGSTLLSAGRLQKVLGKSTITVTTRLFGFILIALAAQLIIEGLGAAYPAWLGK